jgi:D-amino peptidase
LRIYIMTDQEGVAGVVNAEDYGHPGARYYEVARELTTLEVNAAIEGAVSAGAEEFLVVDGHGAGSIDIKLLDERARLLTGRPMGYPFGCDESFGAAFIVGQHARSNTDGGHLSHTGSFAQEELSINGRPVGEMGCNFLFASYFGVPTVFLSGDAAACGEARELVPEIEVAAVKEGVRQGTAYGLTAEENTRFNGAAVHMQPEAAQDLIREGVRRAVSRVEEVERFWLEPPYELVSVLRPEEHGDERKVAVNRSEDLLDLLNMPRDHALKNTVHRSERIGC